MATPFGVRASSPAAIANRPHILEFETPRTATDDRLLEVRNGNEAVAAVLVVDKDGDLTAGAPLTRVLRLLPGREAVRLGPWVIEYNAAEQSLDFLYEP